MSDRSPEESTEKGAPLRPTRASGTHRAREVYEHKMEVDHMGQRRAVIAILIGILVEACSTPAASPSPSPAPVTPVPSASTATAAPSASAGDAWLIVSQVGEPELRVILDSTLEDIYELPVGVPSTTWGTIITATPSGATTTLKHLVVQPGFDGWTQEVDGRWRLPTIGLDPVPVGVSADGSTIVLVEADTEYGAAGADRTTSRFAVVDGRLALGYEPRIVELPGAFDFDALSPNGSLLYVAQQVPGPLEGRYQVRVVETATGVMRPEIIVDKRNVDEEMAGHPVDQERRADGMVMTLYRGTEYPFIHALSSVEAWAVCIDLPTRGFDDEDAADDWGIVSLGKGESDVAINGTLGLAVEIDPSELAVRRSVDFEPSAANAFRLAKFGHGELGPAGRRVVAASDGSALYAAGEGGVVRLGAQELDVEQRYLPATAVDGLALTPDGRTLFALTATGGRIARLDAATGELEGWVGDGGFDRLLGASPW